MGLIRKINDKMESLEVEIKQLKMRIEEAKKNYINDEVVDFEYIYSQIGDMEYIYSKITSDLFDMEGYLEELL